MVHVYLGLSSLPADITACEPTEYGCDNGNCIPDDEVCNGHDNCGDGSDEKQDLCGGGK